MLTIEDVLTISQDRIRDPQNFTQGRSAATKDGSATLVRSPQACKFCTVGSVARTLVEVNNLPGTSGFRQNQSQVNRVLNRAARRLYLNIITGPEFRDDCHIQVNDHGPAEDAHPRVMAIFDLAREMARTEEEQA